MELTDGNEPHMYEVAYDESIQEYFLEEIELRLHGSKWIDCSPYIHSECPQRRYTFKLQLKGYMLIKIWIMSSRFTWSHSRQKPSGDDGKNNEIYLEAVRWGMIVTNYFFLHLTNCPLLAQNKNCLETKCPWSIIRLPGGNKFFFFQERVEWEWRTDKEENNLRYSRNKTKRWAILSQSFTFGRETEN